jgi:hypothetical protein
VGEAEEHAAWTGFIVVGLVCGGWSEPQQRADTSNAA